jgi:hypothetical protein
MRIPYVIDNQTHRLTDTLNTLLVEYEQALNEIIYRLYDLTDDEIATVEAKTG